MKTYQQEFEKIKKEYLGFLIKKKIFKKKNIFFYENTFEKMRNWTNVDFKKTINWYEKIRKSQKKFKYHAMIHIPLHYLASPSNHSKSDTKKIWLLFTISRGINQNFVMFFQIF